ncbi:MAG: hypothetical protein R3220_04265 [Balneolaceae bacterium]|nr:hypothetical protein [Balneolaceae bacterium]
MKHIKSSILFSSGFAGGLLAGWIYSSYKNPDAFRNQKERAEIALSRVSNKMKDGAERLREMNERLKKELSHPIPDLYRATEPLSLDEDELIYD